MTQTNQERDYIEINNRKFVLYKTLLSSAEKEGLKRLEVDILQYPSEENNNTCVCKATAELKSGKIASDIGEANAETLDEEVSKFLFSMASTRSKARCLRNVLAEGITCLEECASIDDIKGDENTTKSSTESTQKKAAKGKGTSTPKLVTVAQLKCLRSMAKRKKWTEDELTQHCREKFSEDPEKLSRADASTLIQFFKEAA